MLKLHFKDQRQADIWLVESVMGLGSDSKNAIQVKAEGVEPQHAEIRKQGDALYLSDVGSYSGTFVNGSKIKQHFQLRSGDVIKLADVELEILEASQAAEGPSPVARSDWSIMALAGELKGKSIPIHGSMVFGRSSGCDIVVNDAHMSRRHAEINLKGGVLRIVDLQSSNGTCVNGDKVGERLLRHGDRISFDHLTFLVAGPVGQVVAEHEEDDDEATVFRAAPIPRKSAAPKPAPAAVVAPVPEVATSSSDGQKSNLPWIVAAVLVIAAGAGLLAFMLPSV